MKRGGYIQRRTPLVSKTRVNPVNRERRAARRAEEFGPLAQYCRELPCCGCHRPAPSDPAHIRSRGAGGKDRANVVPLCRECHQLQHQVGILTFAERKGINLQAIADALTAVLEGDGVEWA